MRLHGGYGEAVCEGTQGEQLPEIPHLALDVTGTSGAEVGDEAEVEGKALASKVVPVDSNCCIVGVLGVDRLHGSEELHVSQAVVHASRLLGGGVLVHSNKILILKYRE